MSEREVIRKVFDKYATAGCKTMGRVAFLRLVKSLSKGASELENAEMEQTRLAFERFSSAEGVLTFDDFCKWWKDPNRFSLIVGKKADLLKKAYRFYSKYSSSNEMTSDQFMKLLEDFGRDIETLDFDALDSNNDGKLSFSEFCDWLTWF